LNTRAPARAAKRVSALFTAVYALAYASLWLALLTPAIISLALRVRELAPHDSANAMSWVLVSGAVVALVSNPLFGVLSDRCRSRFGRRRPFLVTGVVGGCGALALIGLAGSIQTVILGWCLAQLAYNAALAALVAIVPDQIPASQRGTVVGILGICMPVGQVAGTGLVHQLSFNTMWMLLVPGLIGVLGVCLLAWILPDAPWTPEAVPARAPSDAQVTAPSVAPGRRNFALAWTSRVLFTLGSCVFQAYQPFFLLEKLHQPATDVPRLMFSSTLVSAAMVVIWSLAAGRLSDRSRARKPFVMTGSLVQGLGLWMIAAADSYTGLLFGVAVLGTGHGFYEGVDLALITEVLPDREHHAAKDLGLINITNTLPQVIAPLSAPAILALSGGDYSLLFALAGVAGALGSVVLLPLKNVR
jgi:MFS family permease